MFKRGEIALIPVPFTDLSSSKRRPVLIISNDEYNTASDDLICLAITSQIRGLNSEIIITNDNMDSGQIPKDSCVRADKIYTLNQNIVVKRYGILENSKMDEVISTLTKLIR